MKFISSRVNALVQHRHPTKLMNGSPFITKARKRLMSLSVLAQDYSFCNNRQLSFMFKLNKVILSIPTDAKNASVPDFYPTLQSCDVCCAYQPYPI